MPKRIIKQAPKPHILIPDTSAVWHEDKQYVVNPEFHSFYESYAPECSLELYIPEVVRGELLFQQTMSALKSLTRANLSIQEIQRVTTRTYGHRITDVRIKREVETKFDHWISQNSAKIIVTPISHIPWSDVIRKSIWREAPFECDPKMDELEKGFRDALILETIVHFCSHDTRDISIAFLCKDKLLRETAEQRLKSDGRFTAYEAIQDFKTYLDLAKEKLEDAFIKALVRRATDKFFNNENLSCLYSRDNIRDKLNTKYKRFFDNPEESTPRGIGLSFSSTIRSWSPIDGGTFWIAPSRFIKKDDAGWYVWQNTLTYIRQYKGPDILMPPGLVPTPDVRLLVLPFTVSWRARVSTDGRFREYAFISDEITGNHFRPRTEDDVKDWNLEK